VVVADTGLESIGKAAGVGIGTLYRHFPAHDALIEVADRTDARWPDLV
jgi:AcrR family transcriptional regulator